MFNKWVKSLWINGEKRIPLSPLKVWGETPNFTNEKLKLYSINFAVHIIIKNRNGINIIDLVIASNLSNSKSEVKRMIKNKGIKINNETVENDKLNVSLNNFNQENFLKLSHGKKNHVILKIV